MGGKGVRSRGVPSPFLFSGCRSLHKLGSSYDSGELMNQVDRGRSSFVFGILIQILLLSSPVAGQIQVIGNFGAGANRTSSRQGETVLTNTTHRGRISLSMDGKILDPRLATFHLSGGFAPVKQNANFENELHDSRSFFVNSNFSVLPKTRYPLDLRIAKNYLSSSTSTDVLSLGAIWRVTRVNWPSLSIDFSRSSVQSKGRINNESTFTTSTLRISRRRDKLQWDGQFGLQNTSMKSTDFSRLRNFGRMNASTNLNPNTHLRLGGDYFLEDERRSAGVNLAITNRPNQDLNRGFTLSVRRSSSPVARLTTLSPDTDFIPDLEREDIGERRQPETALDATGIFSQTFHPSETFMVRPFSQAFLSRRSSRVIAGDSTRFLWSVGSSVSSGLLAAGYALGLSFADDEMISGSLGTTQQFNAGISGRFLRSYDIKLDYIFTQENTKTHRNRQQAGLSIRGQLRPSLQVQGQVVFFDDDALILTAGGLNQIRQKILTFEGSVNYRGFRELSAYLFVSRQRIDQPTASGWVTRVGGSVEYRIGRRLSVGSDVVRETDTTRNQFGRNEIGTKVVYRLGQTTINLEHRFEYLSRQGFPRRIGSFAITIERPFALYF